MRKSEARRGVGKTFCLNASLCDLSFAGKTKGLSKDIGFFYNQPNTRRKYSIAETLDIVG